MTSIRGSHILALVVAAFLTPVHAQVQAGISVDPTAGPQSVRVRLGAPVLVEVALPLVGSGPCQTTLGADLMSLATTLSGQVPPGMTISTWTGIGLNGTEKTTTLEGEPSKPGVYRLTAALSYSGYSMHVFTEVDDVACPGGGASIPLEVVVTAAQMDSLEITQGIQQSKTPRELAQWLGGDYSHVRVLDSSNLDYESFEELQPGVTQLTLPRPLKVGDLPAPIVENKPGFLRVYLKEVPTPTLAKVRIWVVPVGETNPENGFSSDQVVNLQPGCTPREQRLHLQSSGAPCHSVDFYWDGSYFRAGAYELWVGLEDLTNAASASSCTGLDERWCLNPQGNTFTEGTSYNGYFVGNVDAGCVHWNFFPTSSSVDPMQIPGYDQEFSRTAVWGCQFPPITVNRTDVLVVHPVAVCYYEPWNWVPRCGNVGKIPQMARLLKRVAPTAEVRFSWGESQLTLPTAGPGDEWVWWNAVLDLLDERAAGLPERVGEKHIVFGVANLQTPGPYAGMGRMLGKAAASESDIDDEEEAMAHEMGHVFGLDHTGTATPVTITDPGCYGLAEDTPAGERAGTGYFFWPYADLGNWLWAGKPANPSLEVGLDFTRQRVIGSHGGDPNLSFELMGYCAPQWVTPWSYRGMFAGLTQVVPGRATGRGRFYEVSGRVTASGVVFDPIFALEATGPVDQGAGSHHIVVRGENGSVLFSRAFTPHSAVIESASGSARTESYFSELLPEQPGAASISVVDDNGSQLGALSLGGTAPAVEITFPAGGEVLQGLQNISWSVVDPDSASHTYWVQYSPDGGTTWSTVATSYPETVLPVNFDLLPGAAGTGLIRVYASDGINTGEATAGPVSVPRKPPRATILYPEDGAVLHVGEFLTLLGSGFDGDTGFLSGAALTWSGPSLRGALGTGEQVNFGILSDSAIGNHTLTLTVADADGNQAGATVNFTVEAAPVPVYPNYPPAALDAVLFTNQDTSLSIQLGASDPETDSLTYTVGVPAHGMLTGSAPDLTYQPAPGYLGPDAFSFYVTDSNGGVSNTATVSIVVAAPSPAAMVSPAPGSTLSGATMTFIWTAEQGVSTTYLWVGTTLGGNNLANFGGGSALSYTARNLPTDGSTVHVRLWSRINGALQYNEYTYTAATVIEAEMITPVSSSVLPTGPVTFTWTSGTGVSTTYLWIGTQPGTHNVANFGGGMALSYTANNLPTDGDTLYVRLWSKIGSALQYSDYEYTAFTAPVTARATMESPAPGALPAGPVTFTWTAGTGVSTTYLWIGTEPGGHNLANFGGGSDLSYTANKLPMDGSTLYVRLWSRIDGALQYSDYTYTAAMIVKAALLSPSPDLTLPCNPVTFSWTAGIGVSTTYLWIGITPGGRELANFGGGTALSYTAGNVPTDGSTVYVRLWSRVNGVLQYTDYIYTAAVGGC